ncbi:hypothetical protein WA588_002476, partial [Blastocystis sp. NMH]
MEKSFLVFGKNGWIGGIVIRLLREKGYTVYEAESRLENTQDVAAELDKTKPDYVIDAAGLTGRPNVDWCEFHKEDVIRVNVVGTVALADACWKRKIPCTIYATGCIYEYNDSHPMGSGIGFTEEDEPNFKGSFYSYTKTLAEKLLREYSNVLLLRVRMPISDDLNPRNFVTKISKYERVVDIPNSMSVLHDLLPASIEMTVHGLKGVYNFTNPGVISHNQILELYKKYIDPEFTWKNFSLEEQAKILAAGRSNNELDSSKLVEACKQFGIVIPPIQESIIGVFERMQKNLGLCQ